MTRPHFPVLMVNPHLHVQRQHPYPVLVGEPSHDNAAVEEWQDRQHVLDLQTLDGLDALLEQGDVT